MSDNRHECSLRPKDTSSFPKLPPNASWRKRLARKMRKMIAINPNSFKSKEFFHNKTTLVAEQKRCAQNPHFYVIHPFSDAKIILEFLWSLLSLYTTLALPMLYVFDTYYSVVKGDLWPCHDIIIPCFQTATVFLFLIVGYVDPKTRVIILEPKRTVRKYITTYFFIDFMAAGLFPKVLLRPILNQLDLGNYMEGVVTLLESMDILVLAIRMCCHLIRVNKLLCYFRENMKFCKISNALQNILAHILKTLIVLHILACLSYGFPDMFHVNGAYPKESWLAQAGMRKMGLVEKYVECFLVVICYFFGAAHGKYEVVIPFEQLYFSVVTLFGRLYTLFMLADLLKILGVVGVSESKYEQHLASMKEYMASKNLPENLRRRLTKYYEYKLRKHYFDEPTILATLSEHLRAEIFLFSARRLVQKVKWFHNLPKEVISAIVASMSVETYSPRQVILKSGSTIEHIYFISSGTVAVLNANGMELLHMEDGDQFGIIPSQPGTLFPYQVEAIEATDVFYIEKAMLMRLLKSFPKAMDSFSLSVQQRLELLRDEEERIRRGAPNFLSELRTGQVLEMMRKRPTVQD